MLRTNFGCGKDISHHTRMAASAKRRRLPASPFISPARPVGSLVAGTLGDILARRGFADAEILANWQAIAGAELARMSRPEKLVWPRRDAAAAEAENGDPPGAVLHLRVDGPAAIEVQHMSGQILERVNAFFGFAAVAHLRIIQAPFSRPADDAPADRTEKGAPASPSTASEVAIKGIEDPALAAALARLGRAIKTS